MAENTTPETVLRDNANEVVNVEHTAATDGTFTLTVGGQTTSALDHDAAVEYVEAALEELSTIGSGNVQVTGDPEDYDIEFIGDLANTDVGAVTADSASLVGDTSTVTVVTSGSAGHVASAHQTTVITDPEHADAVQTDGGVGPKNQLDVHTNDSPIAARANYA